MLRRRYEDTDVARDKTAGYAVRCLPAPQLRANAMLPTAVLQCRHSSRMDAVPHVLLSGAATVAHHTNGSTSGRGCRALRRECRDAVGEPFTASVAGRTAPHVSRCLGGTAHCTAGCAATSQRTSETQSRRVRQSSVLQSTCTTRRRYGCGYAVRCDSATSAATDRPSLRSRRDK